MSGTKSPQGGISRRSFLKTTGAVAGAAAVAGAGATGLNALAETHQNDLPETNGEQIFRGVCRPNCFGFCHLNVHVRDGKVVKTSRAPYSDESYNRICHRGLSHVQRIYDPERIKYPMRRVDGTERGAGEWERVSWEEAFDEIASKIKEFQSQYGKQSVMFQNVSGNQAVYWANMYTRLWNIIQGSNLTPSVDLGSLHGLMRAAGATVAWEANERTDLINAKNIVAWGANITESQPQSWHFVNEAMANGTRLVVIDPQFTQIASKADLWIPIRPGSDTALAFGLMYIFIEKDACDEAFLRDCTCAPFLVNLDTGSFLRSPEGDASYMVLSQGSITSLDETINPEIDAECEVDGVLHKTAFRLLKEKVQGFPPDVVSRLTEIPEETLYELADICLDRPVTHFCGFGSQAYTNGPDTAFSGITMCALIGNLGYPGASYGSLAPIYQSLNTSFTIPTGPNPTVSPTTVNLPEVMRTGKFLGNDYTVKMLYTAGGNPLCCGVNTNELLNDVWPRLEFTVVADAFMTDTARYADLVLPIAQYFEVTDVTNAGEIPTLSYNEKAIDPPYEAKSDVDIVRGLAAALGLSEYFQMTDDEAISEILDSNASHELGISLDRLKTETDVRYFADEPHIAFRDGVFSTASGRLEFYNESPTPLYMSDKEITPEMMAAARLPNFEPPLEAWPDSDAFKKYPLILQSERPRFRVHSQWFGTKALRELDSEPTVKINPADAADRGLSMGDYVECYNDRGHCVAKAVLSEGVRPGTLVYPKGWQMSQFKDGSWSELTSTEYNAFTPNSCFMDCVCEVRLWNEGAVS